MRYIFSSLISGFIIFLQKNMYIYQFFQILNGKHASKKPYSADGNPCCVNDEYQDAWVTYNEAQNAAAGQQANGVGFMGYFSCILTIGMPRLFLDNVVT